MREPTGRGWTDDWEEVVNGAFLLLMVVGFAISGVQFWLAFDRYIFATENPEDARVFPLAFLTIPPSLVSWVLWGYSLWMEAGCVGRPQKSYRILRVNVALSVSVSVITAIVAAAVLFKGFVGVYPNAWLFGTAILALMQMIVALAWTMRIPPQKITCG